MFLDRDNKMKLVPVSFFTFYNFYKRKITIILNKETNKLIKMFYLHFSCKKVVGKSNKKNLKVIKNTFPN